MREQSAERFGRRTIGVLLVIVLLLGLAALAAAQGKPVGAAAQGQPTPTPLPGTPTPFPGVTPTPGPILPTPEPVPTPAVTPTPVPGADTTETAAAGVLASLSALLQEHVYGLAAATAASIHNRTAEAQAAQDALERNSADIARLIRSFYGEDAQDAFSSLWDEHVQHLLDYADEVADDNNDREQLLEDLDDFAGELESFVTDANPYLQPGTLEVLLQEHGRLMADAIELQAQDREGMRSILAARQAANQTRLIAATLASAMVRQFSEEVQVLDSFYAAVGAWNRRDVQTFLDLWTDDGLEQEFEVSREEAEQALPMFIGSVGIYIRDFSNLEVNGDEASAEIELGFGAYSVERFEQQFVRENGVWLMDISETLTPEVPEGASVVDVEMDEFAFSYDASEAADGFVSFRAINVGEQVHELALLKLDEDVPPIMELIETISPEGPEPEGVQFIAGTFAEPGEEQTLVLTNPLTPGRYAMVCFLPDEDDPEGTPHAFLGMVSEFEVE